jgi:hypothetical protein
MAPERGHAEARPRGERTEVRSPLLSHCGQRCMIPVIVHHSNIVDVSLQSIFHRQSQTSGGGKSVTESTSGGRGG